MNKKFRFFVILGDTVKSSYTKILATLKQGVVKFNEFKNKALFSSYSDIFEYPSVTKFNKMLDAFDVDNYEIENKLRNKDSLNELHNRMSIATEFYTNKIEILKSNISSIEGFTNKDIYYSVVDTFANQANIQTTDAFVDAASGVVTLGRTNNSNNLAKSVSEIIVTNLSGFKRRKKVFTQNNSGTNIFYEGNYYDSFGQAVPEGGSWRPIPTKITDLSTQSYSNTIAQSSLVKIPTSYYISQNYIAFELDGKLILPDGTTVTVSKLSSGVTDYLESKYESQTFEKNTNTGQSTIFSIMEESVLNQEDFVIYDDEASEDELQTVRKFMVDGDPSTYWQCELVQDKNTLASSQNSTKVRAGLPSLFSNDKFFEDTRKLIVNIEFRFDSLVTLNWIELIPLFFDKDTPLKIEDISYINESDVVVPLPNFSDSYYANILSSNTNIVLDDYTKTQIMASNSYKYRGNGIWAFDPIKAKSIIFKINQDVSYDISYETLIMKFTQNLQVTKNSNVTMTQKTFTSKIPYLVGVALHEGIINQADLFYESNPVSGSSSTSKSNSGIFGFFGSSSFSSSSFSSSGTQLVKQTSEINNNKKRYAIGIRDVNFHSYTYNKTATLYTTTFSSPEDLKYLELEVDDLIPEGCSIKYFISFGDNEWVGLNPVNKTMNELPTRISFSNEKSQLGILNVNKEVRSFKLKISLYNNTDTQLTPKLFGYKVNAYPK